MKTEFVMTLFDDAETHKKLTMLSPLETMFDHSKNPLPLDYYWFSDHLPVSSKVRITMEIVE
jgi:hypothetical protein